MGLFSEIVAPAGLALVYMEAHGIPVDEKRRALLRAQTEETINEHNRRIEAIVHARHAARKARIEEAILAAEAERGLLRSRAGFCAEHPAYNGLNKRSVCPGCQRAFQRSVAEREKDKRIGSRVTAGRTKLKQVGEGFKADNDNHWRWLLFDDVTGLGLMPVRETETGLPGVGEEDIEELQRLYPEIEVLKGRIGLQHALHRLRFVLSVPVDARGRAHFTFSLHRTENGRVASGLDDDEDDKVRVSDGGNAQNIKEEDRQIYCAESGFVLMEHDLEQVELRVMAWLAKDFELLRALHDGRDIHAENAAAVFGCRVEDARTHQVYFEGAWQAARRAVKRATHGWDYGMGDKKAGAMFQPWGGKSAAEAAEWLLTQKALTIDSWKRRLKAAERAADAAGEMRKLRLRMLEIANTVTARGWREGYFAKWPGLAKFQARVIAEVEEKGVLTNPFGRTLRFWNYHFDKDAKRWALSDREEALAFLPASSVGDMVKKMLPEVAQVAGDHGGALLTTTHDSFLSMIPHHPDNVLGYYDDMATILTRDWWEFETLAEFGRLKIPAKAKIGYNWGPASAANPEGLRDYEGTIGAARATGAAG